MNQIPHKADGSGESDQKAFCLNYEPDPFVSLGGTSVCRTVEGEEYRNIELLLLRKTEWMRI